ncbi:MAG: coiled-coil domain-containing protein, partial [Planctomycetota bacterium]
MAAVLMAVLLVGPVLEMGCGSSGLEKPKVKKKTKKEGKNRIAARDRPDLNPEPGPKDPKKKDAEVEAKAKKAREARAAEEKAILDRMKLEEEANRIAAEEEVKMKKAEAEEQARLQAEAELKKQELEKQKEDAKREKQEAEAAFLEKELADLTKLTADVQALTKALKFAEGVGQLETFKTGLKTETAKAACEDLLEQQTVMKKVFEKMVSMLQPGTDIQLTRTLTLKVTKADGEGFTGRVGQATVQKKWTEIDKAVLLSLFEWEEMEAEDELGIGVLAYAFSMPEEAEQHLLLCVQLDPSRIPRVGMLVAAKREMETPVILIPYKGKWVTEEEKKYIDEGKEFYDGKWMTYDEVMKAKGYVKHDGRWLTKEDYEEATKEARKLEELRKKLAPKGLIDKPGADSEQLPWSKARKFKSPGGNYIIVSNLSEDAIKDVAYLMEWLLWNFKKIFRIKKKVPRYFVNIAKNKADYDSDLGGGGLGKCGGGAISTFYQPPNTVMVLMHEGTHQIINKFAPCCPRWM